METYSSYIHKIIKTIRGSNPRTYFGLFLSENAYKVGDKLYSTKGKIAVIAISDAKSVEYAVENLVRYNKINNCNKHNTYVVYSDSCFIYEGGEYMLNEIYIAGGIIYL